MSDTGLCGRLESWSCVAVSSVVRCSVVVDRGDAAAPDGQAGSAGKNFQVWFKMTVYHTKGGPVTAEWETAKSATCRTPTASVAFRCLFPA